jgi:hypothetical protein
MRAAVEEARLPHAHGGRDDDLSLGVACKRAPAADPVSELLAGAAAALYEANTRDATGSARRRMTRPRDHDHQPHTVSERAP